VYVPAGRRIRRIARTGLGQAGCPSAEQLAGTVDCSDLCQAGYGACAAAVPGIPALPVGTTAGSSLLNTPLSSPLLPGSVNLGSSGLASALPWIAGGVLVIILVGGMSGR
jgi:hypothetical protein